MSSYLANDWMFVAEGQMGEPLRVLVIEDEQNAVNSLVRTWDHEARSACNERDAVAGARRFLPDVVLVDLDLPGTDGFQMAKELRGIPRLSGVRLVAFSGDEEHRLRAIHAGFHEFWHKPIEPRALENMLALRRAAIAL